jgi:aspartyl-tRNA(Asn)/glutamyl-tRNA(Gln) amidotransferase subunit A
VPLSRSLDHAGPLCRTVSDAAIVHGALTGSPTLAGNGGAAESVRLRVPQNFLRGRVQPQVRERFDASCARLRRAGAAIESIEIPDLDLAAPAYLVLVLAEAAEWHGSRLMRWPDRYCPGVRIRLEAGRYLLAEDYVRAQLVRERLRTAVDRALGQCDALALPSLAVTATPVGAATVMVENGEEPIRPVMLRLTQPFNMTGHPAITIPCGDAADGLPCGFQLVGPDTPSLLATALACEPYLTSGGTG